MSLDIIIVGLATEKQWNTYSKPCIFSIQEKMPLANIIYISNGGSSIETLQGIKQVSISKKEKYSPVSYAESINKGLEYSFGEYVIIINNDVICKKSFEVDNRDILYGGSLHSKHKNIILPCPIIGGWLYATTKKLINDIGKWDKKFKVAAYEDADYTIRAYKKGYKIKLSTLPFKHLNIHSRTSISNFERHRLDNRKYLMKKHDLEYKNA